MLLQLLNLKALTEIFLLGVVCMTCSGINKFSMNKELGVIWEASSVC